MLQFSALTNNFDFLKQNSASKGTSKRKEKKWTSPLNSSSSNRSRYQILLWILWPNLSKTCTSGQKQKKFRISNFECYWKFWFLDQIYPKKVFPVENGKREHRHWILHIQNSLGTEFQLKEVWYNKNLTMKFL